ncbi:MAG: undecaprenyl-diphosphate phosphatase [Acidobacteriota bacterium]
MLEQESWQAALLGLLQGATEFLPISSSAHLLVLPWLLGWEPLGLTFDVLVHGGTLAALIIYFIKEWKDLSRHFLRIFIKPSTQQSRLLSALIIGTLPAVLVGWLLEGLIVTYLRTPAVVVVTLSGFALILWWADRRGTQVRELSDVGVWDGVLVGMAQALALIPGVSRSGATISAALLLGISRADAARLSFLLGTPILTAATLRSLYELWQAGSGAEHPILPMVIGVIFSFSSGYLCIRFFLRFLQTRTYRPFVWYRLGLAAFILLWLVLGL